MGRRSDYAQNLELELTNAKFDSHQVHLIKVLTYDLRLYMQIGNSCQPKGADRHETGMKPRDTRRIDRDEMRSEVGD